MTEATKRPWLNANVVLAALIVLAMIAIGLVNPAFWRMDNLFNLLRGNVVLGVMALGVLTVMISGGIDVSFAAFAALAMWLSLRLTFAVAPQSLLLPFTVAVLIGAALGGVNAILVHLIRIIPLIATLATASVARGLLLGAIGAKIVNIDKMPSTLLNLGKTDVLNVTIGDGSTAGLPSVFLIYVFLALLVHVFLSRTMIGRSVYAVGGDPDAARRVGFNVFATRLAAYGLAGALAGLAGVLHAALSWNAEPRAFDDSILDVIAAVVLGGASISGGKGDVLGVVLGVFMLVLVKGSLIILGIPTTWQRVCVGAIIIVATATMYRSPGRSRG